MRRKALQGVANTLCHMVDGDGRYRDEERLATLGSGLLMIDALTGESTHNGRPAAPALLLAERMHAWLSSELGRLGLELAQLRKAQVKVPYRVEATERGGMRLGELGYTSERGRDRRGDIYGLTTSGPAGVRWLGATMTADPLPNPLVHSPEPPLMRKSLAGHTKDSVTLRRALGNLRCALLIARGLGVTASVTVACSTAENKVTIVNAATPITPGPPRNLWRDLHGAPVGGRGFRNLPLCLRWGLALRARDRVRIRRPVAA
jgi:hypothetical protein